MSSTSLLGRLQLATSGGVDAHADRPRRPGCSSTAPASTEAGPHPGLPPGSGGAVALQRQFVDIVKSVSPAVVQIQTPEGLGSGIVYDPNGDVVTNAHVVGAFRQFDVTLSQGDVHPATLVGSYPQGDIAVVRVSGVTTRPAVLGDSSKTEVGEFALAIGNPLGLRSSVTQGIVSSVGRTVSEGNGVTIPSAIQTSAPINPGNSGGALVDIAGHVIGIPTLAATDPEFGGAQAEGIGFAIPSNAVKSVAGALISSGRVPEAQRAYLGVVVTTIVGGGVLVKAVVPGGPAQKAGIRAGDIIVAISGQPVATADALTAALTAMKPGRQVPVEIVRQLAQPMTVTVTLGTPPKQ